MWQCENTLDKICFIVALIGMFAGMIACSYGVYRLLGLINAPDSVQLISCIITAPLVGYCFNRFETIVKR